MIVNANDYLLLTLGGHPVCAAVAIASHSRDNEWRQEIRVSVSVSVSHNVLVLHIKYDL